MENQKNSEEGRGEKSTMILMSHDNIGTKLILIKNKLHFPPTENRKK